MPLACRQDLKHARKGGETANIESILHTRGFPPEPFGIERAQALQQDGGLLDDFLIVEAERMIHVLNAPSPAATASITIGRTIADSTARYLGLAPRDGGA